MFERALLVDSALEKAVTRKFEGEVTKQYLASLTSLYALRKEINDLSGLEHAVNLLELHLGENKIQYISSLSSLTNLTDLSLWDNLIGDLTPLSPLVKLTWLDLSRNMITSVDALSPLIHLTFLYLGKNRIVDVDPLLPLFSLTKLGLWKNRIKDIYPLSFLTNLRTLYLEENNISDVSPLVKNFGLKEGCVVDLRRNPLSPESLDVYIPQLQERVVEVHFTSYDDEKLKAPLPRIRLGKPSDIPFCKTLADESRDVLGLLPTAVFEEAVSNKELLVAEYEENSPVAFLRFANCKDSDDVELCEIVIQSKFLRKRIGSVLIFNLAKRSLAVGRTGIILVCPQSSNALYFYEALGFYLTAVYEGRRSRLIRLRLAL